VRSPETGENRAPITRGLRANLAQFGLLVAVNAVVGGMVGQEETVLPLIAVADTFAAWAAATTLLGAGTAMVYPVLLAVIGDVAHAAWRGRAVGVRVPACGQISGPPG
jgi:MFS family permease